MPRTESARRVGYLPAPGHPPYADKRRAMVVRVALTPLAEGIGGDTIRPYHGDHERRPIPDGYRLSISGETFAVSKPGNMLGNDIESGGQCLDSLRELIDHGEPADGWTGDDLARLLDIWERWHLNDTRAGCEHMTVYGVGETTPAGVTVVRYDPGGPADHYHANRDANADACPHGYQYGAAWLYEPLPADVVAWIVDRFSITLPEAVAR